MTTDVIRSELRSGQVTASVTATVTPQEIGAWMSATLAGVAQVAAQQGAAIVGPPFARYERAEGEDFVVEAGFPVDREIEPVADVTPSSLPGGQVAVALHIGPYTDLGPVYAALREWLATHDNEPTGDAWETYLTDPATEPDPGTWQTEIVQPYASR